MMSGHLSTIKHAEDRRVIQTRRQPSLAEESVRTRGSPQQMLVKELDCHVEIQVSVTSLVDDSHATFADLADNLTPTDAGEL
jgi:hypothetical protein